MSTLLDRIAAIAKNEKITISALEREIGASKGVISRAIQKGTDIQSKWLYKIVENYPRYSLAWLLTGEGGMFSTVYDRIDAILEEHNITKKEFAKGSGDIGFLLPRLYENARKRNPADINIARQWTRSLLELFPEINEDWVLYGTGKKYKPGNPISSKPQDSNEIASDNNKQGIPLYDFNAKVNLFSIFNDASLTPVDYLQIPNLPPVDGAVYMKGEAMSPLLKSGDIIIYKKKELSVEGIVWGELYLLSFTIDDDVYTSVRYIQKSDEHNKVRLVSFNPSFAPKDIPISSITLLALVKASLSFHTME